MSIESTNLKKLRKEHNLTQQQFADSISVSKQYLSRVENGLTDLSKEKVILICNKYGVSIDWLLLNKGSKYIEAIEENYDNFKKNAIAIIDSNMNLKIFSEYIEAVYSIIKDNDSNAKLKDIISVARMMFIKDFSIRKLKAMDIQPNIEYFVNEIKNKENFVSRVVEEYYCHIAEKKCN